MTQILVIRHGIAEPPEAAEAEGRTEAERQLTEKGKRRIREHAERLSRIMDGVAEIATSRFVRAIETARIVAEVFKCPQITTLNALAPHGSETALLSWICAKRVDRPLVMVGHEPNLSAWISWTLSGHQQRFVELKKGAAVLLEFQGHVEAGSGTLKWAIAPDQLRHMIE